MMTHFSPRSRTRAHRALTLIVVGAGLSACQLASDLKNPAGATDTDTFNNANGALGLYRGVLTSFSALVSVATIATGQFTDELQSGVVGSSPASIGAVGTKIDARLLPEQPNTGVPQSSETDGLYYQLMQVRGALSQATGSLAAYAPDAPRALRGRLAAIDGYVDLWLADVFCSGVPLSTVDFGKDYTYQPSSTTADIYARAMTAFDSAMSAGADSAEIVDMARVGKGRALLALGRYDEAAAAVAAVPTAFQTGALFTDLAFEIRMFRDYTVADREGGAGLPYRSSRDPRTMAVYTGTNTYGTQLFDAVKYPLGVTDTLVIASGVEARLMEAEAALRGGDVARWLTMTNALRTDGTFTSAPRENPQTAADSAAIDTVWGFGTGHVPGQTAGVRPLADPGTPTARLDSLFADRAAWLFLTGHRQGDLRRLVRNDHRNATIVYPHGIYFGASGAYGNDVTFPIPAAEYVNPLFHGCIDRNA